MYNDKVIIKRRTSFMLNTTPIDRLKLIDRDMLKWTALFFIGIGHFFVYTARDFHALSDPGLELDILCCLQPAKYHNSAVLQRRKRTLPKILKVFLLLLLPRTSVIDLFSDHTVQSIKACRLMFRNFLVIRHKS